MNPHQQDSEFHLSEAGANAVFTSVEMDTGILGFEDKEKQTSRRELFEIP